MKKLIFRGVVLLPLVLVAACNDTNNNATGIGGSGLGQNSGGGSGGTGGIPMNQSGGMTESGGSGGTVANLSGGSGGTVTSQSGRSETGGTTSLDAAVELSDPQIVQVVMTANDGEITLANQALTKAQASSVKAFAQMMVTDHTSSQQKLQALTASTGITPKPSMESQQLQANATTTLSQLSATPSASYDTAYMQSQVAMHQQVLTLVDTQLIPVVADADLDAFLATLRVTIAAHLAQAQQIAAGL